MGTSDRAWINQYCTYRSVNRPQVHSMWPTVCSNHYLRGSYFGGYWVHLQTQKTQMDEGIGM